MFLDIILRPVFISNTVFRRLDSVSIFMQNVLSWTQSLELVPISRLLYQHQDRVYIPGTAQTISER
jgi:hypothetical protein